MPLLTNPFYLIGSGTEHQSPTRDRVLIDGGAEICFPIGVGRRRPIVSRSADAQIEPSKLDDRMLVNPRSRRISVGQRSLGFARNVVIRVQLWFFRRVLGMDIGKDVCISLRAKLDFTYARGVHIGDGTYIAFDVIVFTHDMCRAFTMDTYIGKNCFIGAQAIIMPGVRVGDNCIVGSGAVVTKDVKPGSIVAGNPATVIRSGIKTVKWGILADAYAEALSEAKQVAETRRQSSQVRGG